MTSEASRRKTLTKLVGAGVLSMVLIVALVWRPWSDTANVSTAEVLGPDIRVNPAIEVDVAGLDKDDELAGTALLRDGAIAVTRSGSALLSENLDAWSVVSLVDSNSASDALELNGLASDGDVVLAIGTDGDRPAIWRSRDGSDWERTAGNDAPADKLSELVWNGAEFVGISGKRDLWRSRNGEEWSRQTTSGLERSDDYQVQSLQGFAATGDNLIALEYRELADTNDDGDLVLFRSTDGGETWQRSETEGLEALYEQNPNMPVLPAVGAADGGFVLAAEGRKAEATMWASRDGVTWGDSVGLGGPPLVFRDVDGVALNSVKLVALSLDDGQLIVWRVAR